MDRLKAIYNTHANAVRTNDEGAWDAEDNLISLDESAITTEMARLQTEAEANEYAEKRGKAYPNLKEQFDLLWHAIDADTLDKTSDFYTTLKAVKDAHPKGQPMTQIVESATGASGFTEDSAVTLASFTVTKTQVIPAETVTLTGTLTINTGKTLCLARLFGTDDVTLTTSGAVTITGAGTLTRRSILFGLDADGNFGVGTMSIVGGGSLTSG